MAKTQNDPTVIAKLLRAMAGSGDAITRGTDVIFRAAAQLLDELAESRERGRRLS